MRAFFELIKGVFYLIVLAVSTLYIVWATWVFKQHSDTVFDIIKYSLPLILVLSGLLMTYVVAMMIARYHGSDLPSRLTMVKATILWMFVGTWCAVLYALQVGVISFG